MIDDVFDKLESELADWRQRFDEARLKAHLGKMEFKDKQEEVLEQFRPAYEKAKKTLETVAEEGEERARALGKGLLAGWGELSKTYKEAMDKREK